MTQLKSVGTLVVNLRIWFKMIKKGHKAATFLADSQLAELVVSFNQSIYNGMKLFSQLYSSNTFR